MKNKILFKIIMLGLLIICQSLFANETENTDPKKIFIAEVDSLMKKESFNGAVLIAGKNGIIMEKAYGYADAENKVKNTTETKFQIASLTKQFTATCILKLADEGKLKLNDPIIKYVDFPNKKHITIHHLLSHSSGIKEYTTTENFETLNLKKEYQANEIIDLVKNENLNFEPGKSFEYSNSNYILLGMIIEKITGKRYADYLNEIIFNKIDMTNSGFEKDYYNNLKNISLGYIDNEPFKRAPEINMSFPFSTGGIYSTIEDLYKWDRALYSNTILSEKMKTLMFKKENIYGGYGYGWVVKVDNKVIEHPGSIFGFVSYIARDMTRENVIILLSNCQNIDTSYFIKRIKVTLKKNKL